MTFVLTNCTYLLSRITGQSCGAQPVKTYTGESLAHQVQILGPFLKQGTSNHIITPEWNCEAYITALVLHQLHHISLLLMLPQLHHTVMSKQNNIMGLFQILVGMYVCISLGSQWQMCSTCICATGHVPIDSMQTEAAKTNIFFCKIGAKLPN